MNNLNRTDNGAKINPAQNSNFKLDSAKYNAFFFVFVFNFRKTGNWNSGMPS